MELENPFKKSNLTMKFIEATLNIIDWQILTKNQILHLNLLKAHHNITGIGTSFHQVQKLQLILLKIT